MRALILFLMLSLTSISIIAQQPIAEGREIFENKCARCHGKDGTKGFLGAKNLQRTRLTDQELFTVITEGRRIMPSWRKQLSPIQIVSIINYLKTLSKSAGG